MKKRLFTLFIAGIAATTILTGCGSSYRSASVEAPAAGAYDYAATEEAAWDTGYAASESGYYDMDAYDVDAMPTEAMKDLANTDASADIITCGTEPEISQKMIITWNLSMETEHYDDVMNEIRNSLKTVGGYIESENEYSYSSDRRNNYLTLRIPSDRLDEWLEGAFEYGAITSKSQNQENVTLQYVDMESRINSLRSEQEALLRLMDQATNMEDIITIQSALTDVNYEIESYESQLRSLQNQVSYSTVTLDISEVSREVPVDSTIGQEIREKFGNSMDGLRNFGRNFVIGIVGYSVIIIIVLAIIAAIVFGIVKLVQALRKLAGKNGKQKAPGKKRLSRKERRTNKKEMKRQKKQNKGNALTEISTEIPATSAETSIEVSEDSTES